MAATQFHGVRQPVRELRLKVVQPIGRNQYALDSIRKAALPFAVSVTGPCDHATMYGATVHAKEIDLVARFCLDPSCTPRRLAPARAAWPRQPPSPAPCPAASSP